MGIRQLLSRSTAMDLVGVAGVVGLIGSGLTLLAINHIRDKFCLEPYYRNAIKTLYRNSAALELIGEPIRVKRIDLSDGCNRVSSLSVALKVPFKGSKKSGDLYLWADRDNDDWILRRLEIIFNDIHDKKVLVYKNE